MFTGTLYFSMFINQTSLEVSFKKLEFLSIWDKLDLIKKEYITTYSSNTDQKSEMTSMVTTGQIFKDLDRLLSPLLVMDLQPTLHVSC